MDVFQETDEDPFPGIVQPPGIQGPEVIRQRPEAGLSDPLEKLLLGDGRRGPFLPLVEAHHRLRPETLYGVAHHEDYLRIRGQPVDPGDLSFIQGRVGRCDLARHPPSARLEYRGVPVVVVRPHVELEVPDELPQGEGPRVQPQPVFGLPAPLFVGRALAEESRDGVGAVVDLPVEVVDLFSGHEDLRMHTEVTVQPGGARLLGSYADKIRGQRDPSMHSWRPRARRAEHMMGARLAFFKPVAPRPARCQSFGLRPSRRLVSLSRKAPKCSCSPESVCRSVVSYPRLRIRSILAGSAFLSEDSTST